jgi:hypothetical protein
MNLLAADHEDLLQGKRHPLAQLVGLLDGVAVEIPGQGLGGVPVAPAEGVVDLLRCAAKRTDAVRSSASGASLVPAPPQAARPDANTKARAAPNQAPERPVPEAFLSTRSMRMALPLPIAAQPRQEATTA